MNDIIHHVFVAICAVVTFAVVRKMLTRQPPAVEDPRSLKSLSIEYRKWEFYHAVATLGFAIALGFLFYLGLQSLAAWRFSKLGPSRFLVGPSASFWVLIAMFLAMVFCVIPSHYVPKIFLGKRISEYTQYNRMRGGLDVSGFSFTLTALVTVATSCVLVAFNLNCYTQVTDREIVIKVPWSFVERRRSFDQIAAIASVKWITAMSGNVVMQPHYAIRFKDGTTWTTRDGLWIAGPERSQQLAEYIAAASGKAINEIESIENLAGVKGQ